MNAYAHQFCSKPFQFLDLQRGKAGVCCWVNLPAWKGKSEDLTVDAVWNSDNVQAVRESIHDGSFRYCSQSCPFLHGANAPAALSDEEDEGIRSFLEVISNPVKLRDEVTDPQMLDVIAHRRVVMDEPPAFLECGFDNSCNLACATCRTERIVDTQHKDEILAIQQTVEQQFFKGLKTLYITGSGDPFGSPYFNRWLRHMDASLLPEQASIHLHSNAQLWTREMWAKLPEAVRVRCKTCELSLDAASDATYSLNRLEGGFKRLLENLAFIAELRASGQLHYLKIHMVVQANNFHEMPAFVEMGQHFGADEVYFSRLSDWGTFSPVELMQRQVHLPTHPQYAELGAVLAHPLLRATGVNLGNLNDLDFTSPLPPARRTIALQQVLAAACP